MAQVKKPEIREAIMKSAFDLFAERGYAGTTLAAIAGRAGVATASLYVYFGSKLDLLFAIYRPWLMERLDDLAQRVEATTGARARLEIILSTLWTEIPAAENGFAINLMQAFADVEAPDTYSTELLDWLKAKVTTLLRTALPPHRLSLVDDDRLAHLVFMAFDGFVLNHHINRRLERNPAIIALTCDLMLGSGVSILSDTRQPS